MPVYEFKCKNPESPYYSEPLAIYFKTIEEYGKNKDSIKCPVTDSVMYKIVSKNISHKFIGPGFYTNDYKGGIV